MSKKIVAAVLISVSSLVGWGCDSNDSDPEPLYVVEVAGEETFRIAVETDAQIEMADSILQSGRTGVVLGELRRGDGGFNVGYSWHLEPETVEFPDAAIELCDGLPSFVEEELDYWIDTVGTYCPWQAQIIRRVDE